MFETYPQAREDKYPIPESKGLWRYIHMSMNEKFFFLRYTCEIDTEIYTPYGIFLFYDLDILIQMQNDGRCKVEELNMVYPSQGNENHWLMNKINEITMFINKNNGDHFYHFTFLNGDSSVDCKKEYADRGFTSACCIYKSR